MSKEQVIIELIGSEIILSKDTVSLIKFGFRPEMKLTTDIIKEKGRTTIQVKGNKKHFTKWNDSSLAVSDSDEHMSITLDLAKYTDEVRTDQRVEVKLQPLKINISLLPEVDEDRERKILDDGFQNIDLENEKQKWKKRPTFDKMTFPAFFQTMIENQLTSSEIQVNMAQSLSNAKNRIKELTRAKFSVGVLVHAGPTLKEQALTAFLDNSDIYSQFKDGMVVIGRDQTTDKFTVLGLVTHRSRAIFKILRSKYDAIYIEKEPYSADVENHYLLSAAYIFPYSPEYKESDSTEAMISKVNQIAKDLQKKWREQGGE